LQFTVTSEGKTANIAVKRSSGAPEMDAFAIQCVSAFRYRPAKVDGQPIDYPWTTDVNWLTGAPKSPEMWQGMKETMEQLQQDANSHPTRAEAR
jgi:TonB family protein